MHSWILSGRRSIRGRAEIQVQLGRIGPPAEQREKKHRETRKRQKTGKYLS
jgi:hypothetical protein